MRLTNRSVEANEWRTGDGGVFALASWERIALPRTHLRSLFARALHLNGLFAA